MKLQKKKVLKSTVKKPKKELRAAPRQKIRKQQAVEKQLLQPLRQQSMSGAPFGELFQSAKETESSYAVKGVCVVGNTIRIYTVPKPLVIFRSGSRALPVVLPAVLTPEERRIFVEHQQPSSIAQERRLAVASAVTPSLLAFVVKLRALFVRV